MVGLVIRNLSANTMNLSAVTKEYDLMEEELKRKTIRSGPQQQRYQRKDMLNLFCAGLLVQDGTMGEENVSNGL